jgi:hypothetical protein
MRSAVSNLIVLFDAVAGKLVRTRASASSRRYIDSIDPGQVNGSHHFSSRSLD